MALIVCAGILCPLGAETKSMPAPGLPLYDWGACPYETCMYREWTAHQSVTVYDTWKQGRRLRTHAECASFSGSNLSGQTSSEADPL